MMLPQVVQAALAPDAQFRQLRGGQAGEVVIAYQLVVQTVLLVVDVLFHGDLLIVCSVICCSALRIRWQLSGALCCKGKPGGC